MFNRGLAALPVTEDHVLIQQLCHRVKVVAHKLHSCSSTKVIRGHMTRTPTANAKIIHHGCCGTVVHAANQPSRWNPRDSFYVPTILGCQGPRRIFLRNNVISPGVSGTPSIRSTYRPSWGAKDPGDSLCAPTNPGDSFCVPTYYLGVPRTPPTLSAHQRNIFLGCQGPRRLNLRNDIILSWGVNDPSDYFCAPT
ncbi:uncharacterized protein LOC114877628 isoform X2 [Osmia bicornis bicornis]|uniref:uncharacterized protein LOC114877628 isoform X2 n=1 Tax=Osmia bicornis bicornis TaxID=1437191 RepID=UPI001EAEBE5C|nr:uncharacterized protein LOC114877628 isoform X2 [Osmia bicornis bicornis]